MINVFLNGRFFPFDEAALALNDLGVARGYGVFDVLRTYGPTPFRLRQHVERLLRSAQQIDLMLPWSADEIEKIVDQTLMYNGNLCNVTVRLIATGGVSANFITPQERPTLAVILAPVTSPNPALYTQGAALISVEMERFMPAVKSLNYITAIMAQKRARSAGVVEALYRDALGHVSECTTSNFFIFRDNRLITPQVDILAGVTRGVVLELAEDLFEIETRFIAYEELALADEAFITSTTKEIMPVMRVDDIVIGDGMVGARTQRMMEMFRRTVSAETGVTFAALPALPANAVQAHRDEQAPGSRASG